jgi:hypothetical protein
MSGLGGRSGTPPLGNFLLSEFDQGVVCLVEPFERERQIVALTVDRDDLHLRRWSPWRAGTYHVGTDRGLDVATALIAAAELDRTPDL